MPTVEELAQEEHARDDAPATVPPENYETWKKARDVIDALAGETETAIAEWLTNKGLTATTAKHLWLYEDLERFEIREGKAPEDDERPAYMHGLNLNICEFRLPGVVVAYMDDSTKKFIRLKRNPRKGELEAYIAKLQSRRLNAGQSEVAQAEAIGEGPAPG